jgi:hypothetical protein
MIKVLPGSIALFLALMLLVYWVKPRAVFNEDGSLREFGVGSKKKTITPLWVVAILCAIAAFSVAYLRLEP